MRHLYLVRFGTAGVSAMLLCAAVQAQQTAGAGQDDLAAQLDSLKAQLAEQRHLLEALRASMHEQQRRIDVLQGPEPLDNSRLARQRGTGLRSAYLTLAEVQDGGSAPQAPPPAPQPVGLAPSPPVRPPEVAPLFEQPGVLTPKGAYVLEPSMQFGYSSSNRVALVGYTIIPALLIGLIDVREVKRNTLTGALAVRTGLSNRLEVEARVPYVYRSDATVSRELFTSTASERVFDTSGRALAISRWPPVIN